MLTAVVIHIAFENQPKTVATITVPDNSETSAELVYNLTQNKFGSWSKGPFIESQENPDFDPRITPKGPFRINMATGKEMGHRSTSVGDIILIEDTAYMVDSFGFEIVKDWK